MVIKVVYSFDYLPGKKQEYLKWIKKAVPIFLAPEELKKISAYENWLYETPFRVVEFEFEDMTAVEKYWAREEIKKITDEWADLTKNQVATVLVLSYEKAK